VRHGFIPRDDPERFAEACSPLNAAATDLEVPAHVATGLVLGAASSGVLTNATDLMRWTRALDSDSAALQRFLSSVFPRATASEVSAFMDRVPGARMAGGMFHRLRHGHDLEGLIAVTQRYGWREGATWANHLFLRDFWTPHGIPWLPAGSGRVLDLLTSWGVRRSVAASLLSVNAASLGGLALAFAAGSIVRNVARGRIGRARLVRQFRHALEAAEAGDLGQACTRFASIVDTLEPHVTVYDRLAMATVLVGSAEHELDALEARIRAAHMAVQELHFVVRRAEPSAVLELWAGASVSLHGFAGLLLARAYPLAYDEDRFDTAALLTLRSTVERALRHAASLHQERGPLRPRRPLSATVNYLIAMDTTLAFPDVVIDREERDPLVLRDRLLRGLEQVPPGFEGYAGEVRDRLVRRYPLAVA
jgi:hypothetical protein